MKNLEWEGEGIYQHILRKILNFEKVSILYFYCFM